MFCSRRRLYAVICAVLVAGCGVSTTREALPPLDVALTTHLGDAQTFRDGDALSFFISLGSDAHVLLLYEDANGTVSQLVPNARYRVTFVGAGDFISLPPRDAAFTLRVSAPFGAEKVWLFASEKPLPELPVRTSVGGISRIDGGVASIRDTLQKHAYNHGARYGEASVSIVTQP